MTNMPAPQSGSADRRESSRLSTANSRRRFAEIVDAAAELFGATGYEATSMDDVCAASGIGKGGLYYYAKSKEDLLLEIQESFLVPLIAQGTLIMSFAARPTSKIQLISGLILAEGVLHFNHSRVTLKEHRVLTGNRRVRFLKRRKEFEDIVDAALAEGVRDDGLQLGDPVLARLAFLNLHNYTFEWLQPSGRLDVLEISDQYCALLFNGWVPREPARARQSAARAEVASEVARLRLEVPSITRYRRHRDAQRAGGGR